MNIIGEISGYPVDYDVTTDIVTCKDVQVRGEKLIEGHETSRDRFTVEKGVVLRKFANEMTLGCLALTNNTANQLIKNIKDAKRTAKRTSGSREHLRVDTES